MRRLIAKLAENARLFAETRKLLGSRDKVPEVLEDQEEQAPEVAAEFYPASVSGSAPAESNVRLQPGDLWRRLVLPKRIDHWSQTSLQQRLGRTSGGLVKHARYHRLVLAEGHLTRRLFGSMPRSIETLPVPAG